MNTPDPIHTFWPISRTSPTHKGAASNRGELDAAARSNPFGGIRDAAMPESMFGR